METILAEIFAELQKGASQVKHPFRYFCLSSVEGNIPKQRMVVFRGIHNNVISVYTDIRTSKVLHFKKNPNASVLLYDYQNMKQIRGVRFRSLEFNFAKSTERLHHNTSTRDTNFESKYCAV